MAIDSTLAAATQQHTPRARLPFLDGLRGLSALYIAIFHAFQMGGIVQVDSGLGKGLIDNAIKGLYFLFFSYGYCAVTIFIVLSGYSLMLPVARSSDGQLTGGAVAYMHRRARRIIPAYYAALLLSLLMIRSVPGMDRPGDIWWSGALPAFTWGAITSHILLIQNWSAVWISKINMPMWSVAVEWQIYMLLPTILLPVWRRFGATAMLAVGLAIGLLPELFFGRLPLNERFVAMFAIGAFGACVGFSKEQRVVRLQDRLPWSTIAAAAGTLFGLLMLAAFRFWTHTRYMAWFFVDRYSWSSIKDLLVAIATVALMIEYARIERSGRGQRRPPLGYRLLRNQTSIALGRFSYSLYLTHAPILTALALFCRSAGKAPTVSYSILILLGTPIAAAFAWCFYWVFERPFMVHTPAPRPAPSA